MDAQRGFFEHWHRANFGLLSGINRRWFWYSAVVMIKCFAR